MNTFLEHVAQSLLQKYGSNLSQVTVVFPGKRASLFLNQALAELSSSPVWAPRYQTISELFQRASSFALADPIESVCRLYAAYARHLEDPQPLDRFWSWGEILLSDFDDVDKHLVDARQLFCNIAQLRELDDNSYITPEQEEALRTFFRNFSVEENSQLKEQFLRLWNHMGDIYSDFLEDLRSRGVLYEGALQRELIERLRRQRLGASDAEDSSTFGKEIYAFVGFNVLNDVEQALFDELQARGQALFYWDYDRFYTDCDHEAGHFLRQNLQRYGNELPADYFDNFRQSKNITFITATSENAQARYIPQWLQAQLTKRENRTAVVLCNEQLLQPVLHSLPTLPADSESPVPAGTPKAVNITMGFPLTETPVYSFVKVLVELQTEGYDTSRSRFRHSQLSAVEQHPFIRLVPEELWRRTTDEGADLLAYLLENLSALSASFAENDTSTTPSPVVCSTVSPSNPSPSPDFPPIYRQLYAEALFKTFTTISRLRDLMSGDDAVLDVSDHTLRRILRSILQVQNVPFHGEPATGLQVMGVLETRALDFEHLLLLSVGEGYLPKKVADTSFIPYNLREAFGLTTIRHKIAVYAYYFYRLIQRASHVTFVYNESNVGVRQNELSRFLRQLLAETDFPISAFRLEAPTKVIEADPIIVEKSFGVMSKLRRTYDLNSAVEGTKTFTLSPTAVNTYTTCPLKFYYSNVCNLKPPHDPQEELDARFFGDIFHKAAELVYRQLTSAGDLVRQQDIEPLVEHDGQQLQPIIRQAFRTVFFQDRPEEYSGILIIAERVIQAYLVQLLRHDLRLTPFTVIGVEKRCEQILAIGNLRIRTGGVIDRLDQVRDPEVEGGVALRVVDYKTGGRPVPVPDLARLFKEAGQREHYALQTLLYSSIIASQHQLPVTPCLFFVQKSGSPDYSPKIRIERQLVHDVRPLQDDFMQQFTDVVTEIFNPKVPFTQTQKKESCSTCEFAQLCGR